jgi:protein TonB
MQQGLVQVELSFWQRVYLLWKFRNFRCLSISLFNSRARALLNALYESGERVAPDSPDPSLVIGVVDDFVPPTDRTSASPTRKQELEEVREVPSPRTEGAPQPQLVAPSLLSVAWSRLAAAAGVLCLFAIAVVVWQRIQNGSVSQAHHQPLPRDKVTRRDFPHSWTPSAPARNPPASMPVEAPARRHAALKSAVHPASITARIPDAKQAPRVQSADTIPNIQLSGQGSGIQAPRAPVHLVYPAYPDIPILGVVALTAGVDSGGAVLNVRVVSGQPALARAAINAVRQWHYSPYLKDGEPVATEANILISFFSDDAISLDFTPEPFSAPAENHLPACH